MLYQFGRWLRQERCPAPLDSGLRRNDGAADMAPSSSVPTKPIQLQAIGTRLAPAVQPVVSSVDTIRVCTEPEYLGHRRHSNSVVLAPHVVPTLRATRRGRCIDVGCSCHFPAPDCRSDWSPMLCPIITRLRTARTRLRTTEGCVLTLYCLYWASSQKSRSVR